MKLCTLETEFGTPDFRALFQGCQVNILCGYDGGLCIHFRQGRYFYIELIGVYQLQHLRQFQFGQLQLTLCIHQIQLFPGCLRLNFKQGTARQTSRIDLLLRLFQLLMGNIQLVFRNFNQLFGKEYFEEGGGDVEGEIIFRLGKVFKTCLQIQFSLLDRIVDLHPLKNSNLGAQSKICLRRVNVLVGIQVGQ